MGMKPVILKLAEVTVFREDYGGRQSADTWDGEHGRVDAANTVLICRSNSSTLESNWVYSSKRIDIWRSRKSLVQPTVFIHCVIFCKTEQLKGQ